MNFAEYAGHVTICIVQYAYCLLFSSRQGLRWGLEFMSGWSVVV